MMSEQLRQLIDLFLRKVSEAEDTMKERMKVEEPRFWIQNGVPRVGTLGPFKYAFHGIGCRFHFDGICVDYDYGDQGRIDGFDLWRLTIFGEQFDEFTPYVESGELEKEFDACVQTGVFKRSSGRNDNLYYLPSPI
ncbi:DUF6896 domain-containing protein [Herbaspirillum sp. GCM10030257]|uniref:DUF6896 domain-containing protein n=1 Tax=Herbaspirillum sp. GCM10030257 TaxID=3273393 RepID=UPI0036135477